MKICAMVCLGGTAVALGAFGAVGMGWVGPGVLDYTTVGGVLFTALGGTCLAT